MVEVLACGRNFLNEKAPLWAWVDCFGEKIKVFTVTQALHDAPRNEPSYCGRVSVNNNTYRLICDKCLVRCGLNW